MLLVSCLGMYGEQEAWKNAKILFGKKKLQKLMMEQSRIVRFNCNVGKFYFEMGLWAVEQYVADK